MLSPRHPRVVDPTAIEAVKVRDVYCLICGKSPMREPHHIVPRSCGGGDTRENLVMLCFEHHRAAHDGGLSREYLQGLLRRKYGYEMP